MSNVIGSVVKYGLIAAVIGAIYFAGDSDDNYVEDDIDLNLVLDVTVDTLYAFQEALDAQTETEVDADTAFLDFSDALAANYNQSQPAIYKSSIGVLPQTDASLLAFDDTNLNLEHDEGEELLFQIEIDGDQARIIASSRSGAINDHHFSGTGLLTGYLIGSMLTRQRGAGITGASLASKKPVTAAAARSRAGSGSHSKGK